jgi:acetyltransferase-like isoleucine patch superfamily enzyme
MHGNEGLEKTGMSSPAEISPDARIGSNSSVGSHSIVYDNVVIEDDVTIESHCVIGYPARSAGGKPLVIGRGSLIRSHTVLYEGSSLGPGFMAGHGVLVRENTMAGKHFQVGSHSTIEGDCRIGDFVKTYSGVCITKMAVIGHFVWLYAGVTLTNDPQPPSRIVRGVTISDMAVVAAGVTVLPGVTIGLGSIVGAGSVVSADVPDATLVYGNPAKIVRRLGTGLTGRDSLPYPWPKHFRTGYPPESFAAMEMIVKKIEEAIARRGM